MLVTALGTPTAYGYWGFAVVGQILEAIYGAHHHIHCLDLPGLRAGWSEDKDRPVLVTTDRPETPLSYLLITSGCPVLAFFDEPADALANAVVVENRVLQDGIRFCSQYVSCLMGCTASEHVRFFIGGYSEAKVADFVEAVIAAMGLAPDASVTARVTDRLLAEAGLPGEATVADVSRRRFDGQSLSDLLNQRCDDVNRKLVDWFAANYGPMLEGRELETMEWPRELFGVDRSAAEGEWDVELIGGARHIFWGPYLHLPVGGWRARIKFETVDNVSGNEIEADVCLAMTQVAKRTAVLPMRGFFEFTLEFAVTDPNLPVELRVRLLKGAIEGRFGLRRVALEPAVVDEDFVERVKALQSLRDSLP